MSIFFNKCKIFEYVHSKSVHLFYQFNIFSHFDPLEMIDSIENDS